MIHRESIAVTKIVMRIGMNITDCILITLWIVIFSPSEAAPISHWLMSLPHSSASVGFKNIFYINGPLGRASNKKNLKIDTGTLILVTGQEEIFY